MEPPGEQLMPGPQGKTPRFYEVDKGHKTESYLTAVSHNPVPPQAPTRTLAPVAPPPAEANYNKAAEDISLLPTPSVPPRNQTIGLTESELEEYRDDPFWKVFRWILFILFWLLWLVMFVLAILLVIFSPSCSLVAKPDWWQTAIAYNVWVPSFQDSDGDGVGDIEGLISRLDLLRKSGVQTVWPNPFLLTDNFSSAVRDHKAIDSKLGVNTVADKLIGSVHDRDMRIVVSFPIATTSVEHDWFLRSSQASVPENQNYSNFYYWTKKPKTGSDDHFAKHKDLYYLHEKGNPKSAILNWQNNNVRQHLFEVFSNWIDRGVDGFHLSGVEYLSRKADLTQANWRGVQDVVRDIRSHITAYTKETAKLEEEKKIALFTSAEGAREKDKESLSASGLDTVINYELTNVDNPVERNTKVCSITEGTVAVCTHEILSDLILFHNNKPNVWPHWELSNQDVARLSSRAGSRAHAELLLLLQLVLPGTNTFYYGEEIIMRDLFNDSSVPPQRGAMQWDDSINGGFSSHPNPSVPVRSDFVNINWKRQWSEEKSPLKTYTKLAKLRQRDDTLMSGQTLMEKLNEHAFTVTRFLQRENATTGQIYVCAVNFGAAANTLTLDTLPSSGNLGKAQIVTGTSNSEFRARSPIDLSAKSIEIPADQGVVFRYPA